MANFSDFIKSDKKDLNSKETQINNNAEVNKENLEEMIENYSKFSQDELLNEFMKLTLEKKKKGILDEKELNNIKSTIEPFLNDEQKNNLEKIFNLVRNVWKNW